MKKGKVESANKTLARKYEVPETLFATTERLFDAFTSVSEGTDEVLVSTDAAQLVRDERVSDNYAGGDSLIVAEYMLVGVRYYDVVEEKQFIEAKISKEETPRSALANATFGMKFGVGKKDMHKVIADAMIEGKTPRAKSASNYWANLTPRQKKAEIRRRNAKRAATLATKKNK